MVIERALKSLLTSALQHRPAVYLNGPRQAGKSTLAQSLDWKADYITFDDMNSRLAARRDPEGFINNLRGPVILDEISYVPDLYLPIKRAIDETRKRSGRAEQSAGRFLLTGSTNILALPELSSALVGRVNILTLYPLSAGEEGKHPECFIRDIFLSAPPAAQNPYPDFPLTEWMQGATFPEVSGWTGNNGMKRLQAPYSRSWYEDYIETLIQRDIRSIGEIEKQDDMRRLLRILAARAGQILNETNLSNDIGMNRGTFRRYEALLREVFLITLLNPWNASVVKRLTKAPKIYFNDTPLLCRLLRMDLEDFDPVKTPAHGYILENFVFTELTKQCSRFAGYELSHYRDHNNREIDFIIEVKNLRGVSFFIRAVILYRSEIISRPCRSNLYGFTSLIRNMT